MARLALVLTQCATFKGSTIIITLWHTIHSYQKAYISNVTKLLTSLLLATVRNKIIN